MAQAAQSAGRGLLARRDDLTAVVRAVAGLPDAFHLPLRPVILLDIQSREPGRLDLVDLRLEAAL